MSTQPAENQNCLFSDGNQSRFQRGIIFTGTILTPAVCCIFWERLWFAVQEMTGILAMDIIGSSLGKYVFDGSTSGVEKVHLLLQSAGWQSPWNMVAVIFPNTFPLYFLSDAAIWSTVSWELIEGHSRHTPTYTFVFFLQRQMFYIMCWEKQTVNSCLATACLTGFPAGQTLVQTQVETPFLGITFSLFVLVTLFRYLK